MEIITLILNALPYVIVALVLIGGVIAIFCTEKKNVKQWLIFAVTEARFSSWVDVSLAKMRTMLETNKKIEEYVKGDE